MTVRRLNRRPRLLLTALSVLAVAAGAGALTAVADTSPSATISTPSNVQYSTVHVAGEVNPNGGPSTLNWHFEYSKDPVGEGWTSAAPHEITAPQSEESTPIPVEDEIGGLTPSTKYFVRLAASNEGGENTSGEEEFETKGPVTAPTVTIDPPSLQSAADTSYAFTGHVNPGGTDPAFETEWHFSCEPSCGSPGGGTLGADESNHLVETEVSGLNPKTTYVVTLHATNAGGESTAEATFKTAAGPPIVALGATISRSDGSAPLDSLSLKGFVNPRGATVTDCHFSYGLDENYGHDVPCEPGLEDPEVQAPLHGLTAGATYHFRLRATTLGGFAESEDQVFKAPDTEASGPCSNASVRSEQSSGFLPDCRAYEQVSPVDKNGGGVLAYSGATRASTDGDALTFGSLTAFGDVQGTGITAEYLASRTASGWVSHGIDPVVMPGDISNAGAAIATYYAEMSPNLDRGILYALLPQPTLPPGARNNVNLFQRSDLSVPGSGSFQLLTPCPLCEEEDKPLPALGESSAAAILTPGYSAASPDLETVAFESMQNLTNEVPPQGPLCGAERGFFPPPSAIFCTPHLYEWSRGTLRLAGILPNGQPADASVSGQLGHFQWNRSPHLVSDGSDGHDRVMFIQPTNGNGETVSQLEPFEAIGITTFASPPAGNLFMRIDGDSTIQLNVSERTEGGSVPFAPAEYLDASSDGERVFFRTTEALTNDAPVAPGSRLIYMYDASKPPSAVDNLTLINKSEITNGPPTAGEGIIGTSEDGHFVYFINEFGQLLPGHPQGIMAIYLWHDNKITEVARIRRQNGVLEEDLLGGSNYFLRNHQARVSPDGRHLVFSTTRSVGLIGPTGYDHGDCETAALYLGCREIYVYSYSDEQLQCASCMPTGQPAHVPNASAHLGEMAATFAESESVHPTTTYLNRALSADGRYTFFTTAEALVSRDTNGVLDAYEYDSYTGRVSLLSTGTSSSDSYVLEAGESGDDVFIATSQQLTGTDTDGASDVYDVRVGGGFPEPPPQPAACEGEACQGSNTSAPLPPSIGSGLEGQGNRRIHRRHHKHHRPKHRSRHRHSSRHGQAQNRSTTGDAR